MDLIALIMQKQEHKLYPAAIKKLFDNAKIEIDFFFKD